MDTKFKSEALSLFTEISETLSNKEINKWKAEGGKVAGYFCASFPEELLAAAGLLTFRMRATGSDNTELSDSCFSSLNCAFPRHAFNLALKGDFDFLDGLVTANSCDTIRRTYDHWKKKVNTPFVEIVSMPKKAGPSQVKWFTEELSLLKDKLENHFSVEITDEKLRETIQLHNHTRKLQRSLYEVRKETHPPISGADALAVTVACTAMPKETYNQMLEKLLEDLGKVEKKKDYKTRLMILGGELDNPGFIKIIEDQGALVVTDSLCFGSRMFWEDIDETIENPIEALSQYYIADRPSCPRVFGRYEERIGFIKEMVEAFEIDGVIFEKQAFCDSWGIELFSINNDFKEWNVPLLVIEREYVLSSVGQLKTRVQAFLETISGKGR